MAIEISCSTLQAELASYLDRVVSGHEVVIVKRQDGRHVALIPADELVSLTETAHLLRSPKNARRLSTAFRRAETGEGRTETVDQLRDELCPGA